MSGGKHIPIEVWLKTLGLSEYLSTFKDYNGVEDLLHMNEADIRKMGIKNSGHRACLVSSLLMLKNKLNKKSKPVVPASSLYSQPVYQPFDSVVGQTSYYSKTDADYYVALQSASQIPAANPYGTYPGRSPHSSPMTSSVKSTPASTPLEQFPWYHGNIPREKAEKAACKNGDFLIRDSISSPGEYVLTCCWEGTPLHFMVNKRVINEGTPTARVQYLFEEDFFCSLPDLIEFHVAHKKPISMSSGAIISNAVIRNTPLDYFDIRPSAMRSRMQGNGSPMQASKTLPRPSPKQSPINSPILARKILHRRTGSQPLLSIDDNVETQGPMERHGSLPSIGPDTQTVEPKINQKSAESKLYDESGRSGSEPSLLITKTPIKHEKKHLSMQQKSTSLGVNDSPGSSAPPPKPSRVPSIKLGQRDKPVVQIRNVQLYDDGGEDYSDYDTLKAEPSALSWDEQGHVKTQYKDGKKKDLVLRAPKSDSSQNSANVSSNKTAQPEEKTSPSKLYAQVKRKPKLLVTSRTQDKKSPVSSTNGVTHSSLDAQDSEDYDRLIEPKKVITIPDLNLPSDISVNKFMSDILPAENKPLDADLVKSVKSFLLENDAKRLARHLTHVDLEQLKVTGDQDLGVGITNGLELLTLPHGKQLREDMLERYNCMAKFVATTILMCTDNVERAKILHQWICVAAELMGSMGNLWGFSSVVEGLQLLQVTRLKNTWTAMKQLEGNSGNVLESKLKPLLTSLNNANDSLPNKNIIIPHIAPLVLLIQREGAVIRELLSWEDKTNHQGIDAFLSHLEAARKVNNQLELYKVRAEELVNNFSYDRKLLDLFKTEFHLRMMWGFKGASANQNERYIKYNQLLTVLSERAEPSQGFNTQTQGPESP